MADSPRDEYAKKFGEKAADRVQQAILSGIVEGMAKIVRGILAEEGMDQQLGFTLILFEFGEGGNMSYASTAQRGDFLRLLDEMRGKLAAVTPDAKKGD